VVLVVSLEAFYEENSHSSNDRSRSIRSTLRQLCRGLEPLRAATTATVEDGQRSFSLRPAAAATLEDRQLRLFQS
jgi:hypothetical protein